MITHHMKLIILLVSVIYIFYFMTAYPENTKIIQIRDEILLKKGFEKDYAIEEIDKLQFKKEELVSLYMELLNYYIGEGPGEILSEKITSMGDKILPFLISKKNMPLKCEEKYKNICYTMEERNRKINYLIDAIKDGRILYAVYPELLKKKVEGDMKIIRIFIEDFKKQKGGIPKDLYVLREYAWKQYGYKLRIINPWGQPIKYLPKSGDQYILEAGKYYSD